MIRRLLALLRDRDVALAIFALACAVLGYSAVQQADEAAASRMAQDGRGTRYATR